MTYCSVDQADTQKLAEILDREYQGESLDLVVDDASHLIVEALRLRSLFRTSRRAALRDRGLVMGAHALTCTRRNSSFRPRVRVDMRVREPPDADRRDHRPERIGDRSAGQRSSVRFLRRPQATAKVNNELMRNLNRPWSDVEPDPSDFHRVAVSGSCGNRLAERGADRKYATLSAGEQVVRQSVVGIEATRAQVGQPPVRHGRGQKTFVILPRPRRRIADGRHISRRGVPRPDLCIPRRGSSVSTSSFVLSGFLVTSILLRPQGCRPRRYAGASIRGECGGSCKRHG